MTKMVEKHTLLPRFRKDRRGNFAMMGAVALPVILGAGGFAMDLTNMVLTKAELQDAVDSASLAAASALSNDKKSVADAKLIAMKFFKTQLTGSIADGSDLSASTNIDIQETPMASGGKSFKVSISTGYDLQLNPLTRLFGYTSTQIGATGTAESATESKNALSMFLVLDRSGSMSFVTTEKDPDSKKKCQNHTDQNWFTKNLAETSPCYISKIRALKTAVASLFQQLNTADPKGIYVRTGAASYNDDMLKDVVNLGWGTGTVLSYVNAIPAVPEGGTDSSGAFAEAVTKLRNATEGTAHKDKNGQVPSKYIVFMTDGDNTHYQKKANTTKADEETKASCQTARDAGIEVYTVAFMAPTRGQNLLKACATTTSHYFEATNMAALVAAFKAIGDRTAAVISRLTN